MNRIILSLKPGKATALLSLLLFSAAALIAQIPAGYYSQAEGKSKGELKTALHKIINSGVRLNYGSGSDATWSGFEKSDRHPDGYVWDMYSSNKRAFPGNGQAPGGMNIEHSVAKSWWGGSKNYAYCDLYHLNPSDSKANTARSNYPLGTNDGSTFNNGVIKVGYNTYSKDYTGLCFEPLDEYKGDFARAYMYMFTCYENLSWQGNAPNMINTAETYPMLRTWARDMLLEWSRMDPVSEKELNRAAAIAELQKNRNPFIDYPELAEYLWGNKVGQPFTTNQTDPVITNPMNNSTLELPSTHYTATSEKTVSIRGLRLTGNLNLTLSGSQSAQFALSRSTITKEEAMAGIDIYVTFMPVKSGTAVATLTINGGGVAQPVAVTLKATATDSFAALPATGIMQHQFTANWTSVSTATDYELNVYQRTTQNSGGEKTIFESNFSSLPSGWSTDGYTECNSNEFKMASGKQDGVLISPPMDLSGKVTLVVKAKKYGNDSNANLYVSVDNQTVSTISTTAEYKEYRIELPNATTSSTIKIKASKGARVYMSRIALVAEGETIAETSIQDFPKRTGLVTSFNVTGLKANQTYYYTVKSIGGTGTLSEVIEVKTLLTSATGSQWIDKVAMTSQNGSLYLFNLPLSAKIKVTDINGRVLASFISKSSHETVALKTQGVVIVTISSQSNSKTIKTVIKK